MYMERLSATAKVGVGTSLGNSDAFSYGDFASGIILVPSSESGVVLEFYTCDTEDGTFLPVNKNDATTTLSVSTTGGRAKELPPQLFGAHYVKIVADAISAGTSIAYTILLKA